MKPGTKKTVRLATTFTGVAAFAPTALAGALPPVGPHLIPNTITVKACSAPGTSHWLHLALGHSGDCLGGTGFIAIDISISKFCGGNNSGTIRGNSVHGARVPHNFHHGTTYALLHSRYRVTSVDMDGFAGTDRCPAP
jgi:hypothetical protein